MKALHKIQIRQIDTIRPPSVEHRMSPGGVPVFLVRGGSEPVLHFEMIFRAGKGHEQNRAAAHATAAMLTEGTTASSSKLITEQLEFYGATLRTTASVDVLSVSVYCMSKVFDPVLRILAEMLSHADFPDHELSIYQHNRAQKIRIALQQNETLANRALSRSLFGKHVYGDTTSVEDVMQVRREHLLKHFELIGTSNLAVFVCGHVEQTHLAAIDEMLDDLKKGTPSRAIRSPEMLRPQRVVLDGPQKLQSAMRFGRQMIQREDPDFTHVFVLNAVLGGFFGSRLMKNIREDKGLTYSIYSSIETLIHAACLIISTETDPANKGRVEREILLEIERLQQDLVAPEELRMVKNYLMGNMMMQLDGPFRAMDTVKTMVLETLDDVYFDTFIESIQTVSPEKIREMAGKYLAPSELHVSIVG